MAACKVQTLGHQMWRDVNMLRAGPTLVYFRLGKLQRVSTYVQQMWGIIGHVTVEAGSPAGTDGAPPQYYIIKFTNGPVHNFHHVHSVNSTPGQAQISQIQNPHMD